MPIFRGTNNIKKIFRGNNEIVKVFRGTNLIFQSFQFPQYEELADIVVTSNTTQIDFNNLNITKDDELRLVYTMVGNNQTTFSNYRINVNNNTTSNYFSQQINGNDTGFQVNRQTLARMGFARSLNKNNGFTDIKISNNNRFVYQCQYKVNIGSQSSIISNENINGVSTFEVTSINKISIISSNTGGIAVGSRLQLYKVNTGVA